MKYRKLWMVVFLGFISLASAFAQEPLYKGKTVRIIVGFSPGGGLDVYSRAISRHVGQDLPGGPNVGGGKMSGGGRRMGGK